MTPEQLPDEPWIDTVRAKWRPAPTDAEAFNQRLADRLTQARHNRTATVGILAMAASIAIGLLVGGEYLPSPSDGPASIVTHAAEPTAHPGLTLDTKEAAATAWWDSALETTRDDNDLPEDYQALANLFFADLN